MRVDFPANGQRKLSVAPMMDWTDRHCRSFHRILAPDVLLYTEMVTTGAVLHGDRDRLLAFGPSEHPLALQLGGSDPAELAACGRIAERRGFDEINLNVGCPSDRVQKGRFGACLMLEPALVRDCIAALREVVDIPVTVKCRLGVDDRDSYAYFSDFVQTVAGTGCETFIVHARKAWLSGLSPKENRQIPELRYEWVYRLKQERPDLTVVLNGGVGSVAEIRAHLRAVDGVMLGRAAYQSPWLLAEAQSEFFARPGAASREQAVAALSAYLADQVRRGVAVKNVSRHVLGLFQGEPGARRWRRFIAEHAHLDDRNSDLLGQALAQMVPARRDNVRGAEDVRGARNAA